MTLVNGNTARSRLEPISKFGGAGFERSIWRRTFSSSDVMLCVVKRLASTM